MHASERPAHLVLDGRRAVRVEDVALVEGRRNDAIEGGLAHCGLLPSVAWSSLAASRRVSAASHPGTPECALYRLSRSTVSRRRQSHALSGSCSSISARHVDTGSRNAASFDHDIGATCRFPSSSRQKMVPLNWNINGTSPVSSAKKYLPAVIVKSCVHA